jgi:YVTN family beta-propeller protein
MVTVIDGDSPLSPINVGSSPQWIAFDVSNGYLYVANGGSDNITVIDGATNSVVTSFGTGCQPDWAAVDDITGGVYVVCPSSQYVTVFNGTTDSIMLSINVGPSIQAIGFDSENGYLYASNAGSNSVAVVNGAIDSVVGSISVGPGPFGMAFDSSNGDIYVASSDTNGVSVVAPYPTSIPSITSFAASPNETDVGNTSVLSASVSGGATPYSYSYTNLPQGCTSTDSPMLNCTPTSNGTFLVHLFVNDSGGWPLSATVLLTVYPLPSLTSFTATPSIIDIGSSTTFLVSASDGIAPYSYSYVGLPQGCASYNTHSLVCTPTALGRFNIHVFVNDSIGAEASSLTSILVDPTLTVSSFTATSTSIDFGGSTTLRVTASGGTRPYDYEYSGLPSGCISSSTSSLPCIPNTYGTYNIRVFVNDSAGMSASMTLLITVNQVISLNSFVANPGMIDLGNSSTLSVSVSGGASPYNYEYTGLPGGCRSYDSLTLLCTPSVPGDYLPRVFVNDSAGYSITAMVSLEVNPSLQWISFTASRYAIDLGGTATFSVLFSGGSAPFGYTYTGLPTGCMTANQNSLACSPEVTGDFTVRAYVNDSNGRTLSSTLSLTVNSMPTITLFSATPSALDLGSSVRLAVVATGGTYPYTITYTGLPGGCVSYNSSALVCGPNSTGTFPVRVFVNDSAGLSVNESRLVTVNSPLSVSSLTVSRAVIDLGSQVVFTVSASGGTAPFTYSYYGLPDGCSSANLSANACRPSSTGTFDVLVTTNDSAGMSLTLGIVLTVNPDPSISSFAASPITAYYGQAVYLNVSISGGTAPFVYEYRDLPRGCASQSTTSLTCTSLSFGSFKARIYANDSEGRSATAVTFFNVTAPIVLKAVAVSPITAWVALYKPVYFSTDLTCSGPCPTGPSYTWTLTQPEMGDLNNLSRSSVTFTAKGYTGTVGLFVNVTLNGTTVENNATIAIFETLPSLSTISMSPSSATLSEGSTVVFEAFVTCSTGPCPSGIRYLWTLNNTLGKVAYSSSTYSTFASGNRSGSIALTVTALLDGKSLNSTALITITSPSSPGLSFLGLTGDLGYILLAALFIAIIVILMLVLLLRRREESGSPEGGDKESYRSTKPIPISPETPAGYYSEMVMPHHLISGLEEKDAYGTFEASPEVQKPGALHSAYEAFSITITPSGIQVEEGGKTGLQQVPAQRKAGKVPAAREAVPKVSEKDAYAVLVTLEKQPQGLDSIKQDVHLNDSQLTALLGALAKGKMVAKGQSSTRGTVYALTPLGRKLGHRFIVQGKPGEEEAKETKPTVPSESKTEGVTKTDKPQTPAEPASSTQGKPVESAMPASSAAATKETEAPSTTGGIVLERTLGEERNEENPFEGDIKPEDINPNVRHLDPKLLQPMELRVQGKGSDNTDVVHPEASDDKAKDLMDRAKRSRMKPKSRFGFMRAKKPDEEESKEQDKEQ